MSSKREKDGKRGEIYRRRFFLGSAYWFFIKNWSFISHGDEKGWDAFVSLLCAIKFAVVIIRLPSSTSTAQRREIFFFSHLHSKSMASSHSFSMQRSCSMKLEKKRIFLRVFRPERVLLWIHKREKTFRHYFSLCTLWSFMTVSYSLTAQRQSFTWKTHQILNIPFDSILIELIVELIIK